jgi:hypothetical protein
MKSTAEERRENEGATESRDQSDFTTPADGGVILLRGASRVSGKLLSFGCPRIFFTFLLIMFRFLSCSRFLAASRPTLSS